MTEILFASSISYVFVFVSTHVVTSYLSARTRVTTRKAISEIDRHLGGVALKTVRIR